jgi:hypothetical protein
MAILNNSNAISSGGYDINNSLRFRASASAYLKRTPSASGNQQTWTWSGWVKRGALGSSQQIFASDNSSTSQARLNFTASDTLSFLSYIGAFQIQLVTTQVFRDPSAWYHIILVLDTTNATASNRTKIYVNGTQVTAFSTATYSAQNYNGVVNNNLPYYLGSYFNATSGEFLDGYMSEVNFIDGQALTPSSFGETDTTTGSWKPKAYTGTYGTNGFYLKFSDIATTSGSNAGLGKDFSGNANYWTTNNISVTAGVTYDAMIDSPTLTSATQANYAVMNPLALGTSQTSLIQGNLYAIPTAGASNWGTAFSTIAIPTSGKYYIEATAVVYTGVGNNSSLGVVDSATFIPTNTTILYQYTTGEGFDGILCHLFSDYVSPISDGVQGTNVTGITGTSVNLMLALDVDNGKVYAGYNGTWLNSGNPAGNTGEVATRTFSSTDVVAGQTSYNGSNDQAQYFNFGQRPFAYTPPTGFVRLNTFNLPDSTIKKGNTVMDATLYTGNGSTQTITNASGFKPDLVWVKSRSNATDNELTDSVRGVTKSLISNSTAAEATDTNGLTAFNSNGFTLGTDANYNGSARTFVGWQWQAGQGSSSSNTSGTITSTVSVNATAGFSIATFTNAASGTQTFGHGLGVAPAMVIAKARSSAGGWVVYHKSLGNAYYLFLDDTSAATNNTATWNSTSPTSTVVTMGNISGFWGSSYNYVAYCWAAIAGYSAFGSYTGNGSTDGPFNYVGFRPKFIMLKRTDTTGNWTMYDATRNTYNAGSYPLYPNLSNAEDASLDHFDWLSNGFKMKSTNQNASGGTFIYACFASNPFKNSNAV